MAEPLGDKGIRDVPGIGDVLGTKLAEAGYEKVGAWSSIDHLDGFVSFVRHTPSLESIYYVIKMLKNFKNGFKPNAEPIHIKRKQPPKPFPNGPKRSFRAKLDSQASFYLLLFFIFLYKIKTILDMNIHIFFILHRWLKLFEILFPFSRSCHRRHRKSSVISPVNL